MLKNKIEHIVMWIIQRQIKLIWKIESSLISHETALIGYMYTKWVHVIIICEEQGQRNLYKYWLRLHIFHGNYKSTVPRRAVDFKGKHYKGSRTQMQHSGIPKQEGYRRDSKGMQRMGKQHVTYTSITIRMMVCFSLEQYREIFYFWIKCVSTI